MSNKNKHVVNGYISYSDEIQYKWITEAGKNTCERCKSLNGKIFDKDNLPKRPHPNCRCRVEEISIVDDNTAKLYGYRDEKSNLQINAQETLGDLRVLKKKLDTDLSNEKYPQITEQKEKLLQDITALEIEINRYIDRLSELTRHSSESFFQQKHIELIQFREKVTYLNNKIEQLKKIKTEEFILPVNGKITSKFGYRISPTKGASSGHSGVDIGVPIGTPIKAIREGTVIAAREGMRGYGTGVFIDHGIINKKHITSEYGHLSQCNVKVGDKVSAGQIIGKSGNSGISTGPHLHLTIKENGIPVDPQKYFNKF